MRCPGAVVLTIALSALAGCGHPWPAEGRGGMAERDTVTDPGLRQMRDAIVRGTVAGSAGVGAASAAGELYVRAVREQAGGLHRDANRSMAVAALTLAGASTESMPRKRGLCLEAPCR